MAVTSVAAAIDNLVLRHVPRVHDRVAALVPAAAGVRLAAPVVTAASSGSAGVLKATAV